MFELLEKAAIMAIETKDVEIKQLLFDPGNPRLPEFFGKKQPEIFRFLVDEIGIDDVLQSMAASGVIEGDPIIARKAEKEGQFYVIEGNRRLAALKLLNGEKIRDGQEEPLIPTVSPSAAPTIKKVKIQLGWTDPD